MGVKDQGRVQRGRGVPGEGMGNWGGMILAANISMIRREGWSVS